MLKAYFNAVKAEKLKLKRSHILLPCLILPLLGTVIGSGNFMMNREALSGTWTSLWTQVALFYGYFFYPILIAVCASCIWRVEHRNHNWNFLMTAPVSGSVLFAAKLSVLGGISLLVQVFLGLLYWCSGTFLLHFQEGFPAESMIQWIVLGWISSLAVSALQLYLSMRIRSFAIPVGIGLGVCVAGLMFYAYGLGKFFPTSLLTLQLGAADGGGISFGNAISNSGISLLYLCLFFLLAVHYLKKVDITAG